MIKNITKRIFALAAFVAALCASAPSANAQFRYGPTAGVDLTNLKFKQDLMTVDQNVGFSGGIMAELMFPGVGFGIDFGALYQMRGATLHLGERTLWADQGYGTERTQLHYISIPLHLRFKFHRLQGLEDYVAPFVFAGPNFGFLAGHNKIDALEYAGGDVGIDFGAGVELYGKWQISASYCLGMSYELKAKILTDYSAQNRSWQFRVAWLF